MSRERALPIAGNVIGSAVGSYFGGPLGGMAGGQAGTAEGERANLIVSGKKSPLVLLTEGPAMQPGGQGGMGMPGMGGGMPGMPGMGGQQQKAQVVPPPPPPRPPAPQQKAPILPTAFDTQTARRPTNQALPQIAAPQQSHEDRVRMYQSMGHTNPPFVPDDAYDEAQRRMAGGGLAAIIGALGQGRQQNPNDEAIQRLLEMMRGVA